MNERKRRGLYVAASCAVACMALILWTAGLWASRPRAVNGTPVSRSYLPLVGKQKRPPWTPTTTSTPTGTVIAGPTGITPPPGAPTATPTATHTATPTATPHEITVLVRPNKYHNPFRTATPDPYNAFGAEFAVGEHSTIIDDYRYPVELSGFPAGTYTVSLTLSGYHPYSATFDFYADTPVFWTCANRLPAPGTYDLHDLPIFREDWTVIDSPGPLSLALEAAASAEDVSRAAALLPPLLDALTYYRELYQAHNYHPSQYIKYEFYPSGGCGGLGTNPWWVREFPSGQLPDDLQCPVYGLAANHAYPRILDCLRLYSVLSYDGQNIVDVIVDLGYVYAMEHLGYPDEARALEGQAWDALDAYVQAGSPFETIDLCDGQPVIVGGREHVPFDILTGMFVVLRDRAGDDYLGRFITQEPLYPIGARPECDAELLAALGEYMRRAAAPVDVDDLLAAWNVPAGLPSASDASRATPIARLGVLSVDPMIGRIIGFGTVGGI